MSAGEIFDEVDAGRDDRGGMRLSSETGKIVLAQLRRQSRALRVAPEDRDDIVQDVAIWIARHREADRPITTAWLRSLLLKFARSVGRPRRRETALSDVLSGAEPTRAPRRVSASPAELTQGLGQRERRVVELLLEGHTWEAALRSLGIRRGSHSRWRARIRERIRKTLEKTEAG
ncbi:MAG: hypothetical protein WCC53_11210 [Thermoanaerobaculia bacterium]|jgi:DNA-directed RNA polymerase specialized sigma24 family protein